MQTIYESKNTDFCYVPIPKHASTWGNYVFEHVLNFEKKLWSYKPSKNYIVIIRDPLDKWFAGVSQYIWQSRFNANIEEFLHDNFVLDPLHLEMIFSKISFDVHTMGLLRYMREYTPGLDNAKPVYFYFNDTKFMDNISRFIYKKFDKVIPTKKKNETKTNIFKTNIRKQLEYNYNTNTRYKNTLDEYFKEDYEFIKAIKFYKAASNSAV